MKKIIILLSLFTSQLLFAHCPMSFQTTDLCADIKWIEGPSLDKLSSFELSFWKRGDQNHQRFSPHYEIDIYTWMNMSNGHSHGGPKIDFTEVSNGLFYVENVRFFMHGMKGHWQIRVDLKDGENLISTGILKVNLTGSDTGHHHKH